MTIADTLRHLGLSAPDPRSDGELVERFVRTRDEAAFTELLRRHGPTVYGVCRRVVGHGPDSDDSFQAVFLVLARKAGTVRPPGMVGNWLYGVAVRTANKARVMNAKRAKREQASRERERPECRNAPVAHAPGSPDTLAVIDAELAALPDMYRAAFVACDLNGRSRSEAARELGWPEGTVAARVAKARELLAARLRKRGVTLGSGLFAAVAVPTATATDTLHAVRELLAVGTASTVAPAAQHLSDEVVKSMTTIHAKWLAVVGVLTLTLATGSAVMLAGGPDKPPPVRELIKAPVPKVAETKWTEETPIEFKDNGRVTSIAFAPSGKTFAVVRAGGQIDFYDPVTRKHQQSMNFLGDAKSNPKREGATSPALAFRPTPHAKLGDVFAITHKNGVNYGTTGIGLLVDEPQVAVDDVPSNWVMTGMDPRQVAWLADDSIVATNGADVRWRMMEANRQDMEWTTALGERGRQVPLAAFPGHSAYFLTDGANKNEVNELHIAVRTPGSSPNARWKGHKARLVAAAVSADGKRAVSADEKGTLIVWEGEKLEFKEKSRVELGEGAAQLALAPDGKTVAVLRAFVDTELLGRSGRVLTTLHLYVFDVTATPEKLKPLWTTGKSPLLGEEKSTGPFSLAFSPDGKTLLAAFGDPAIVDNSRERGAVPKSLGVRVWTLGEEKIKAPVPKPLETEWKEGKPIELENGKRITSVAYSPDGTKIAIGQDGLTTQIETETRKVNWYHDASGPATRVAYSPDGGTMAATFDDGVRLFDTRTGKLTFTLEEKGSAPTAVAFFPDRPTPAKELQLHQIAFGHPGKLIVKTGVSWDKASTITSSLTPKGTAPEGITALPLAVSPTGDGSAVTLGPTDRKTGRSILWMWGAGDGAESKELTGHKGRPTAAAWAADGSRVVTADDEGTVIVWDTEEFKEKSRVELRVPVVEKVLAPKPVSQLALAPDGKTLAVLSHHRVATGGPDRPFSDTNQFELRVFDVTAPPKEPKSVWTVQKPFVGPSSLAFAPDGKTLLVAVADTFEVVTGEREKLPPSKVTVLELVPKK